MEASQNIGFKLIGKAVSEEKMFKLVRKMIKIVLYLFGFEAKTLVLVAPVPGHCSPLTFQYVRGRSYKSNVSVIILQNLDELSW